MPISLWFFLCAQKKVVLRWANTIALKIVYASYLKADAHILSAYNTQLYTTIEQTHAYKHTHTSIYIFI